MPDRRSSCAITMENHGPLHLERVSETDVVNLYSRPPPTGCEDLTIYLRHLRNADRMLGSLRAVLASSASPGGLCWFGDNIPIMTDVYSALGLPERRNVVLAMAHRCPRVPVG